MSGLAEILHEEGFTISGSDSKESDLTKTLAAKGIKVIYGQSADNITTGIDLVVYTAAIHESNPEFAAAKAAGIPMLTRAELLGQIMDNYDYSIVKPFNPEVVDKVLGDDKKNAITCRPADLLEPELDKIEAEMKQWKQQDEDVLSYALFPQVATDFFKYRQAQQTGVDAKAADTENKAYPV